MLQNRVYFFVVNSKKPIMDQIWSLAIERLLRIISTSLRTRPSNILGCFFFFFFPTSQLFLKMLRDQIVNGKKNPYIVP